MSKTLPKLNARLMFEAPCPICGKAQDIPVLSPENMEPTKCTHCGETIKPKLEHMTADGRSALQLLELALGKWLTDIMPVCGDISALSVEAEFMSMAPLKSAKPAEQPVAPHEEDHRSIAGLDIPDVNSLLNAPQEEVKEQDPGLLTSYSMGSATGVDEITKLLKSDPANRQLKEWLAFAYYRNNELKDAVKTYLELIETDPSDINSHYYLANSYYKLGYNAAAAKGWEKVQALAPDSPLAKKAKKRALKVA